VITLQRPQKRPGVGGQALVEFALIFPVLILMLVAVFDLGRLVFAYNDITNAGRTGIRVAIVDQTANLANSSAINQATSLGLVAANVTVRYRTSDLSATCPTPKTLDCVAEVTVSYQWRAITPIIGNVVGPVTVTAVSRMPLERIYP
jgi:Flp pilus assembly protein TadG